MNLFNGTDRRFGSSLDHLEGSAKNVLFTVLFSRDLAKSVYFFLLFERAAQARAHQIVL
jgi:hypothetical protein